MTLVVACVMMTYLMRNYNWPTSVDNAVVSSWMFHVGHTKFFHDVGFRKIKHKFWIPKVGCLNDIASVMQTSTTVKYMKYSQLVGNQQSNSYYESTEFFKDKQCLKAKVRNIRQKGQHLTSSVWPNALHSYMITCNHLRC